MDSNRKITVQQLDQLMEWFDKKPNGKVETIFALIQILTVFLYVYVRSKLLKEEDYERGQKYINENNTKTQKEILSEDLDNT
jgi:hypothetical protein